MESFKVICKGDPNNWYRKHPTTKLVTTNKFFGLFKSTKMVSEREKTHGPGKDEICIVIDTVIDEETFYVLAGYPNASYHSKLFIRLDEFTETQKEIAEKSQPVLN